MESRHFSEVMRLQRCRELDQLNRTAWMFETEINRGGRRRVVQKMLNWLPTRSSATIDVPPSRVNGVTD